MRHTLAVLLMVLCATGVYAGELGITWDFVDHSPPPYSYNVLRDGVVWPNVSGLQDPRPTDPTRVFMLATGLPPGGNCTASVWQVQAVNEAGASGASTPVSSIARPAGPGGTGTINVILNNGGVHQILGDYFPPNIAVSVDGLPVATGVNRLSCQLIEIPNTEGLPISVCVTNPALPLSSSCWANPGPTTPTGTGVE